MQLTARTDDATREDPTGKKKETTSITVSVPPTRTDILHEVDIAEDVAIAYGYNNVDVTVPDLYTVAKELPINQLTELLRTEIGMAGFTEILTWALCSRNEIFEMIRKEDDGKTAVGIANPATLEFEVCRTSLLPAALKTLGSNKDAPLPVRLFEVSDVVTLTDAKDVGATNRRRMVAVSCSKESSFEVIHGLLNRVMEVLGVPLDAAVCLADEHQPQGRTLKGGNPVPGTYSWREIDEDTGPFFPGRAASIHFGPQGRRIGEFGVVHPEVLHAFDIPYPVSAVEIDIEALMETHSQ